MTLNTTTAPIELPEDLFWALDADAQAKAIFDKIPQSHRKEYINWIESARKAETRAHRVQQALAMIVADKKQQ